MPRPDITALIAANLHSMPHPDGKPRRFMHYSQFAGGNTDTKTQAAVHQLATDHGDSLQHLLETHGYTITHQNDPKPADADNYKTAHINCTCGTHLLDIGVDTNMTTTLNNTARQSLAQRLQTECPRHD